MDPERASLLVTKLLADIVPGDLAVVRLLDLDTDSDLIPSRPTGQFVPCQEDPSQTCQRVEAATDWEAEARSKRFGVLDRPARGDASYKEALEQHLEQRVNNSMFHLAFRAAQGVFDEHRREPGRGADVPRTVIWLSDGRSDHPPSVQQAIRELGRAAPPSRRSSSAAATPRSLAPPASSRGRSPPRPRS